MAEQQRDAPEQRAQEPDAEGNKIVEVLIGPYRGQRLKMPAAEADQATADHWARDPFGVVPIPEPKDEEERLRLIRGESAPKEGEPAMGEGPPYLSDEERRAAHEASTAWAQAQWDAAQELETEDMRQVREARQLQTALPEPTARPPHPEPQRPREQAAAEQRTMTPTTPVPGAPGTYDVRRGPGRPPGPTRRE
jgi:hypothetical protein